MGYEIEKGIEMPPRGRGMGGRKPKYPWLAMAVGDSFKVELLGRDSRRIYALCSEASARYGRIYRARLVMPGEMRVWRIE